MTNLGKYLFLKSAKKAAISRRTGISEARLSLLSNDITTILTAEESYLIALSLDVDPGELQNALFGEVKLKAIDVPTKIDKPGKETKKK
ncbi:putative transcriptional regulator [bacterium A37T11]|nr:putative transcriptional regulator [bacterium A37T11]